MQLQITTDYAIRILLYLSKHKDDLPTAQTIAQAMGITYPFFVTIASKLKKKGLITGVQGRLGGYRLPRPAEQISLYDVYRAIEGELYINRCLYPDNYCSRNGVTECEVHDFFVEVQDYLVNTLTTKTIADF